MTKLFELADQLSGEDIRSIRKKLYLTQKDFAELVNVSIKTVEIDTLNKFRELL